MTMSRYKSLLTELDEGKEVAAATAAQAAATIRTLLGEVEAFHTLIHKHQDAVLDARPKVAIDACDDRCFICEKEIMPHDFITDEVNEGWVHATCIGIEREGFVQEGDDEMSEPLGPDEAIPVPYLRPAEI